ncbi:hypothetical protein SAFG77S_09063 [Streptomyces afghaniensis]
MDEVQKFISKNHHQLGYIMQEASRQWIENDPVGALTVGDCNLVVQRNGQYHELLAKLEKYEKEIAYLKEGHRELNEYLFTERMKNEGLEIQISALKEEKSFFLKAYKDKIMDDK